MSVFETNKSQETPESNQSVAGPTENVSSSSALTDLLGGIKNERGEQKYATAEEALKGAAHAQSYIQELKEKQASTEAKLQELSNELEKRKSVEESISNLSASQEPKEQPTSGLDENAVLALLEKREADRIKQSNMDKVQQHLVSQFGDKAAQEVQRVAKEYGITPERIGELSAESPALVMKQMFGVQQAPSSFSSGASVNTETLGQREELNIKANDKSILAGASGQEILQEARASSQMLSDLEKAGMTIDDMSKPSNYFKYFG